MAVFRAEIQIKFQPLPVVRALLAFHQRLLDLPVERNLHITGNLQHERPLFVAFLCANRPCQASFHVSPKDTLISRLTLESASRQIAISMNARSPFPANKRSNDSDLA